MESIYWKITGKTTSYPQNPSKRKPLEDIIKVPSILKVDGKDLNPPPISSESSLNVKFYGESEIKEKPLGMTLSEKIKSLTASLNKINTSGISTINTKEVKEMLQKREEQLRAEFNSQLEKEVEELKARFDSILKNEQARTSYMLSGAHRERKEKIKALKTQLECKNLAGLMYVLCSERKKSKMQEMKIVEEYTKYIKELHAILKDSQEIILNLSRGYKTASRVDREWRAKITAVLNEFRAFVYNFAGGSPDTNQFFFNLPEMLKITAPIRDNPDEDPCECEEDIPEESIHEQHEWWERYDTEERPFVVFGDMERLTQPQKAAIKMAAKTVKTAPQRWKEYNFDNMPILSQCDNFKDIKDAYLDRISLDKWECHVQSNPVMNNISLPSLFPANLQSRRVTAASIDYRNMGSILKIITTTAQQPLNKTMLLGAKDSMEIASTTRLKRRSVLISNAMKMTSEKEDAIRSGSIPCVCMDIPVRKPVQEIPQPRKTSDLDPDKEKSLIESLSSSRLGDAHNDSLEKIPTHKSEKDRVINYEKVCPMPECQLQVDSFIRSLPEYMRANPFTHFEVDFDEYETCSPGKPFLKMPVHFCEQLKILKERIDARRRDRDSPFFDEPLAEWVPDVDGVYCQTSDIDTRLPSCTCRLPQPTPVPSVCKVYDVENLLPLKKALDQIKEAAFYDPTIEFDRFEIIGDKSNQELNKENEDFKIERVDEIIRILRAHPSLNDLFQANTSC